MQKRHNRTWYNSESFCMAKQRQYVQTQKLDTTESSEKMFKHKPYSNEMRRGADDEQNHFLISISIRCSK